MFNLFRRNVADDIGETVAEAAIAVLEEQLADAKAIADIYKSERNEARVTAANLEMTVRALETEALRMDEAYGKATTALNEIIAMETPGCAHVGKKMAAKAREGVL